MVCRVRKMMRVQRGKMWLWRIGWEALSTLIFLCLEACDMSYMHQSLALSRLLWLAVLLLLDTLVLGNFVALSSLMLPLCFSLRTTLK